jgi:NAD(P)H-dependent FMN reductase
MALRAAGLPGVLQSRCRIGGSWLTQAARRETGERNALAIPRVEPGDIMSELKVAIILGSTRPGRNGKAVADWVVERAAARSQAKYELVDLADYPLPHLDEPLPPSYGQYAGDHTKAWALKIASYDAFIFVTPEYNHSTSAVLKNAIDYLAAEWYNKTAAFVSYGSLGGARAIEHLRAICSELQIAHVRQQLSFSLFSDFEDFSKFRPQAMHDAAATVMFDQLEAWAAALQTVRVLDGAAVPSS